MNLTQYIKICRYLPIILLFVAVGDLKASQFTLVREHTTNVTNGDRFGITTDLGDLNSDGIIEYGVADIQASGVLEIFDGDTGVQLFVLSGYGEHFGGAGCAHPDINGDGIPEFAIGESEYDGSSGNAGIVRVFSGADAALLRQFYGPASQATDQGFGWDMMAGEDINSDGLHEIFVGARKGGTGGHYSGSLTCVDGATGALIYVINGQGQYDYQSKVGLLGPDIDGDGFSDFAVAAEESYASSGDGYVKIISAKNGNTILTIDGWGGQNDYFGSTHCWKDDLDGDGLEDIVIAADGQDYYGPDVGRVGVFSSASGALIREILPPPGIDYALGDAWGVRLIPLPDSDGDGFNEVLIPARGLNDGGSIVSAVFVCSPATGATLDSLSSPTNEQSGFGASMELLTSYATGHARIIIGGTGPYATEGAAYVFDYYGATTTPMLADDFEDGILDPSKWIANGPGTVTEENGQAVSRSRGHLTTVNEFSAELDGLRIAGEINYQGRSSLEPTFKIAWRSEIGANGTAAEALAGAKLYFGEPAPTQGFIRYVGISPYGGQAIDEAPFEMQAGESVRFLIKDFGGIITAEIENIDTGQTVSLSGTLPYTTSYGDHVKFYTREAPYNTTAGFEEIEIGPYQDTDPVLAVNNLVSGQAAIVRVSNCTPLRPVMVIYSFAGGGPTNTPWGIFSLAPPYYFFAPRIASSAGVAQFGKWIPNRFAGMDVWMQAVDWNSRAISNGLALTVQ